MDGAADAALPDYALTPRNNRAAPIAADMQQSVTKSDL
jgi:hypothetical protein